MFTKRSFPLLPFIGLILVVGSSRCLGQKPISQELTSPDVQGPAQNTLRQCRNAAVPTDHPRILIRPEDLGQIKLRIGGAFSEQFHILKTHSKNSITAASFVYVINGDEQIGRFAIQRGLESTSRRDGSDLAAAQRMQEGAIAYDWCYPLLTQVEKGKFHRNFIELAALAGGYPWNGSRLTGHGMSYLMAHVYAGLAMYEHDRTMFDHARHEYIDEFIPMQNVFYQGHGHPLGSYGIVHYAQQTILMRVLEKVTGADLFDALPFHQSLPFFWIYLRRADGQFMRWGDTFQDWHPIGTMWSAPPFWQIITMNIASRYKNPILHQEFLNVRKPYILSRSPGVPILCLLEILWRDQELTSKPHSELALSRFFGKGIGAMMARTGWNRNAVVALFKIGRFNVRNHDHQDRNCFQIAYKGGLIVDSGLYEGEGSGYASAHWLNYYQRTIAHNTMLIHHPDEPFRWGSKPLTNDGGQFPPNRWREPTNLDSLLTAGYEVARVDAHEIHPAFEYTYAVGDATPAYRREKLQEFRRHFVFLNGPSGGGPAAVVIYDRVEAVQARFKKTWVAHSMEKPTVTGAITIIERTDHDFTGRAIVQTLLPESPKINLVYGFVVDGKTFETQKQAASAEPARWRVEISPPKHRRLDHFLNVIHITERDNSRAATTRLISGNDICGAVVGDRVVIFADKADPMHQVTYTVPFLGPARHLVTGLVPRQSYIVRENNQPIVSAVSSEAGTLYFHAHSKQSATYHVRE